MQNEKDLKDFLQTHSKTFNSIIDLKQKDKGGQAKVFRLFQSNNMEEIVLKIVNFDKYKT